MNTKYLVCFLLVLSKSVFCEPSLREGFEGRFLVGVALNRAQVVGEDARSKEILKTHFNSVTAENEMKWESVQPEEGVFDFAVADKLVDLGQRENLKVIGHTLLWHNQTPSWVFEGPNGEPATREMLLRRLKSHIETVVGRYRGKIHGWDVVNEAFNEDGSWRESEWYNIIGPDYIEHAFRFARDADPEAELYYNDYNMYSPGKRRAVLSMVDTLHASDLEVHAIGFQGHYSMGYLNLENLEESIAAISEKGVGVMFTELDLTVLPFPDLEKMGADISLKFERREELDPFSDGLSREATALFEENYLDLFRLFLKYEDTVSRVTLWGISDQDSWRNNWPVEGRTDYPLLFDRNYQAKPVVWRLVELAGKVD